MIVTRRPRPRGNGGTAVPPPEPVLINEENDAARMKKRTILKGLLPLLMLIAAFPAAPAAAEEAPYLWDLTGDGATTAADAAAMLRGIADATLDEMTRPDLDFTMNGEIDATDARAALLYACGGIEDWVAFGERVSSGLCDERLFDRFSYTGTQSDGLGNYRSENVSVSVVSGRYERGDYYLADIYVQDIASIRTALSGGKFRGGAASVKSMFNEVEGAIIAINGDFYSIHLRGPIVRNGVVYEDGITRDWDIAVLYTNGEMKTYAYGALTQELLGEATPYQSWIFGPALLDEEGHAKTTFRSYVQPENPRSVIAYYEPGHYAFLAVDGRSSESQGLTMQSLSALCEELGFTSAYNLDGGRSSVLLSGSGAVNNPYRDGRAISDIVAVRELPQE